MPPFRFDEPYDARRSVVVIYNKSGTGPSINQLLNFPDLLQF